MAFSNSIWTLAAIVLGSTFSMIDLAYDAGLVNQLLVSEQYFEYFALNATWIGLIIAMINVGNLAIGLVVGPLMDRLGRKRALYLANIVAMIAVILQSAAQNIGMLLAGRFFLGVSFGISGVCGPTLVAEATPGHLYSVLANTAMLGLPIASITISAAGIGIFKSTSNWGWRIGFIGEGIPPLISCIILIWSTESPRWLLFKGRPDEARQALMAVYSDPSAEAIEHEFQEISQTLEFEKDNNEDWKALVEKPSDRRRFLIAVLTNIFYQTCGASTLPYFFSLVLASCGITDAQTAVYCNVGLSIWGSLSLGSGLWITSRFGSKSVMVFNTTVITICLVLLAILSALGPDNGRGSGALAVTFIFWWASSSCWMILEFTYPVEILRFSLRGKGTAIAQWIGYAFQLVLNYTLATALERISWKFYVINAVWDTIIIISIWMFFVEIKGKTLEEMDAIFDHAVHFSIASDVEVIDATRVESLSRHGQGDMDKNRKDAVNVLAK